MKDRGLVEKRFREFGFKGLQARNVEDLCFNGVNSTEERRNVDRLIGEDGPLFILLFSSVNSSSVDNGQAIDTEMAMCSQGNSLPEDERC